MHSWDDGPACPPDVVTHFSGLTVGTALGWIAHPGGSLFEIGPVLRFDAFGDRYFKQQLDYVATLNLELGLALFSPDQSEL